MSYDSRHLLNCQELGLIDKYPWRKTSTVMTDLFDYSIPRPQFYGVPAPLCLSAVPGRAVRRALSGVRVQTGSAASPSETVCRCCASWRPLGHKNRPFGLHWRPRLRRLVIIEPCLRALSRARSAAGGGCGPLGIGQNSPIRGVAGYMGNKCVDHSVQ